MYTKENILQILRLHKAELQKKYPIAALGLFGSYARGEATEESDIDVLVDFNGKIGLVGYGKLAIEIESILHKKIDLVQHSGLKDWVRPYVENDLIYV